MTHDATAKRTFSVSELARVEGEGAMHVTTSEGRVTDVRLEIYEPPRFFEALLRGRSYTEPPDITARICGICPVAYQMSSCLAMESLAGVTVDGPLADLRRLLYCGEWIESHALHIYLLHAPDFLGYPDAIGLAGDHRDLVQGGLDLKKVGNDIMSVVGGRPIHPINIKLGGFYRAPTKGELEGLREPLERARQLAYDTVHWVAGFDFPDADDDYEFLALRHPDVYPIMEGRIASTGGIDVGVEGFLDHVTEEQVPHSTALHAYIADRRPYLAGPMARWALNADRLSPAARDVAREVGLEAPCRNPFRSIVVRAVETFYACDEALRLIDDYTEPDDPAVEVPPVAGVGHGATEAPRGLLYHRYEIDPDGLITDARIIPPTSQNQARIEEDLRRVVEANLELSDDDLTHLCEQAIRNYDPCISCSTHFLDLTREEA